MGSALGCLFMAFVACPMPNVLTVCITLITTGLGLGFTMGAPLNYMMLQNTEDAESNSALATLSLVRSIGTAVAPAIMVAFIVHASAGLQDDLMSALPDEVSVSPLPNAQILDQKLESMRASEDTAEMLKDVEIPSLSQYSTIEVNMDSTKDSDLEVELSDEIIAKLQDSDVTTIVGVVKEMTGEMFDQIKPQLTQKATDGISSGIAAMEKKSAEMKAALDAMSMASSQSSTGAAISGMQAGDADMASAQAGIQSAYTSLNETISQLQEARSALPGIFDEAETNYMTAIDDCADEIRTTYQQTLDQGFRGMAIFVAICSLIGMLLLIPYKEK